MKKVKDIAIFGAGGFGREVACLLRKINAVEPTWNFIGFYDDGLEKGSHVDYGEILGGIADLNVVESPQRGGGFGQSQNAPNCGGKNHQR